MSNEELSNIAKLLAHPDKENVKMGMFLWQESDFPQKDFLVVLKEWLPSLKAPYGHHDVGPFFDPY